MIAGTPSLYFLAERQEIKGRQSSPDFNGIELHFNRSTLNLRNSRSHGFYEIFFFSKGKKDKKRKVVDVLIIVKMTDVLWTQFPILAS